MTPMKFLQLHCIAITQGPMRSRLSLERPLCRAQSLLIGPHQDSLKHFPWVLGERHDDRVKKNLTTEERKL